MIPRTAYVLGNSPTLPVDRLHLLARQFTVGVNRIMRSGFTPTVLVAADPEVNAECAQAAHDAGVLVLSSFAGGPWPVVPLRPVSGEPCWRTTPTPKTLHVDGSTGVAAARWARSLGCELVCLLGMSGTYADDGRTDFYGVNRAHLPGHTANVLRGERDRLLWSSGCYIDADCADLTALAGDDDVDQDELRSYIRRLLA